MASYTFPSSSDTTAHNFEPAQAAEVAAALVSEDAYLSALINIDGGNTLVKDENGRLGMGVNIRIPSALVAHDRAIDDKTTGITLDEIRESTKTITLGRHAVSAVSLNEQELNFGIEDFSRQVLKPQGEAVAAYIEGLVEGAFSDLPESADAEPIAWDPADPTKTFTAIRKVLRKRGVPLANLNVVVGTEVYGALLDAKAIEDSSQAGDSAALREGNAGKIRGFNIVESLRVGDDEIIAFHRDAYTLSVRAPKVTPGAPFGAMTSAGRFPLRWTRDYDTRTQAELSVLSTFAGIGKMPLYKIDRAAADPAQRVVEVPEGAVLKVDTASAPVTAPEV